MDDSERDEILYRLDERTKRVDERLTQLDERVSENEEDIDVIAARAQRNESALNFGKGVLGVLATALSGLAAKVAGLIHL